MNVMFNILYNNKNMSSTKKFFMKCFTWEIDMSNSDTRFFVSGKTLKNESVTVRIDGFCPVSYLQLPNLKDKRWTEQDAKTIFNYFKVKCRDNAPIDYKLFYNKRSLYCLEEGVYIQLVFKCNYHAFTLQKKCLLPHNIRGVYNFNSGQLKVHEQNIDSIIKFPALRNIQISGWIEIEPYIPDDSESIFSDSDINAYCRWNKVKPVNMKKVIETKYRVFSYDIETYSQNHNSKLPDANVHANVIFQIGGTLDDGSGTDKKYLLSLYDCPDITGVTVLNYENEKNLIKGFIDLCVEIKPDFYIGYNILKFDWEYIIKRAKMHGIELYLSKLSGIHSLKCVEGEISWSSSAYKTQKFKYLKVPGKLNIDLLPEIQRNYKFDKYSLDFVSEKLLGENKDDMPYLFMFRLVQICLLMKKYRKKKELSKDDISHIKIFLNENIHSEERVDYEGKPTIMKNFLNKVLNAENSKDMQESLSWGIYKIGKYCVQDTKLPLRLLNELHIFSALEQMSNTTGIPISYLQTRGQQIKLLSQVYRITVAKDIIIPYKQYIKQVITKFKGAKVFTAVPGDYDNVACLDFSSLYPSIIIAYNICWTTYVTNTDVEDDLCHVLEFEEHYLCEHDQDVISGKKKCQVGKTKKTKQKDGTIIEEKIETICRKNRYRFLKAVKQEDGTYKNEGVLPMLLKNLLATRKIAKKEMTRNEIALKLNAGVATNQDIKYYKDMGWPNVEKNSLTEEEVKLMTIDKVTKNAEQLALKVASNSGYGGLGTKTGFMPFLEGAATVTAMGRRLIQQTADFIKKGYEASELIYGDSVTGDTPLICKRGNKDFDFETIEELCSENVWKKYHGTKEMCVPENTYVWTDEGFAKIKKLIRHKTKKEILRVTTHKGCVDVTSDHSLLNENKHKVRPRDLKIGDTLLHHSLPSYKNKCDISSEDAYLYGLFYAHGSLSKGWSISHKNFDIILEINQLLEKKGIKNIVISDSSLNYNYKIFVHGESEEIKSFISFYKKNFLYREKIRIPLCILKANDVAKKQFLNGIGYLAKSINKYNSACLYYLYSSLSENVGVNSNGDICTLYNIVEHRKITYINNLGKNEDYVYDIETSNGHFSGGIGEIVLHNTDSVMISFNEDTLEKNFRMAEKASEEVTKILPHPLFLEFENMYGRFFLLSKKRYVSSRVNEEGKIMGITEKGVVLARRDNTHYLREVYREIITMIRERRTEKDIMNFIYDATYNLFTQNISPKKLVIFKSVQDVNDYTKDSTISHVMLAKKMIERGDDVPANTRLEYVFLDTGDPELEKLQGNKAEDYYYYRDNKLKLKLRLDPIYYLKCQLKKPISEVLKVKYPGEEIEYIEPEQYIFGYIVYLSQNIQKKIYECKTRWQKIMSLKEECEIKVFEIKDKENYEIVLKLCNEWIKNEEQNEKENIYKKIFGNVSELSNVDIKVINRLKGKQKLIYILNNSISTPSKKLLEHCNRLLSIYIIINIRKTYGIKAKRWHKPRKNTEQKIIRNENLMDELVISHQNYREVVLHLNRLFSPLIFEE